MRIAIFCPSYGAVGGIETIATSLIAEFRQAGHTVTVLARGAPSSSCLTDPVAVIRLPYHQLPRRLSHVARHVRFLTGFRPAIAGLRRVLGERRIDVVLTLAISTYAPYVIAMARSVPVVVSLQGGEAGAELASRPRILRRALIAAARVVACATTLATQARALAPEIAPTLSVIPNGVEPARFGQASPCVRDRPYVLAVGRLVRQKGFDVLLEAFGRLGPSTAGVDLLIAGDGPERAGLEAARARLGLAGRVHFLGSLAQDRVASLYGGALLVACPSRWEGLPLVCLETMASGRPLIATAVDGIPDAVRHGETGVVIPPERPDALADALAALLADAPARERLGAAGQRAVREQFAWSQVARRYLALLTASADTRARV